MALSTKIALVYKDSTCKECYQSLAAMLQQAGLQTKYVTGADLLLDSTFTAPGVFVYAQPGGDNTDNIVNAVGGASAWPAVRTRIQNFIKAGGRAYGVCLGGFLFADSDNGYLALDLTGDDASYFTQTGTKDPKGNGFTNSDNDQILQITWYNSPPAGLPNQPSPATNPFTREVYFQGGPEFIDCSSFFL